MKRKLPKFLVLALVIILITGLAASVSAATDSNSGQNLAQQCLQQGRQRAQTALNALSDLTGLSIADIRNQRAEEKSLASIAEDKGVSEQALIDKIAAERKAALDQLKADGKITEDQYQACIANLEARVKANVERTTIGPNGGQGQCLNAGQGIGQGSGHGMGMNRVNCPNYSAQ